VKVKFTGTYDGFKFEDPSGYYIDVMPVGEKDFEYILEASANIGGNSEDTKGSYMLPDGVMSHRKTLEFKVEVIEVSGTISEAK